jgi:nucleoside phosphorylase
VVSVTDDAIKFTLAEIVESLRERSRREQTIQLVANAAWWLDAAGGTPLHDSPWATDTASLSVDDARLHEAPYVAALGFLFALESLPFAKQIEAALSKIARRAAHTNERTGYADHPLVLAGLWLGARSLNHSAESQFRVEARRHVENDKTTPSVLAFLSTIEPDIVEQVGPFNTRSMSHLCSSIFLAHANAPLSEALYGKIDLAASRRRLAAAACEGKLGGLDELDACLALIALRETIATMTASERTFSPMSADHRLTATPLCDVGIITIKDEEFEAVLNVFRDNIGLYVGPKSKRHYNLKRADAGSGKTYSVAIVRNVEQGNADAQAVARDMIEDLCPTLILVVGIAGGRPTSDFTLGDVVLSLRVNDYSVHAHNPGSEPTYATSGGPVAGAIEAGVANLKARLTDLGDWTSALPPRPLVDPDTAAVNGPDPWQKAILKSIRHHFQQKPRTEPKFVSGAIGSSDGLIKEPDVLITWLSTARNLLAVEMESAGVHKAARERCSWLAIRGISDIVGLERSEDWTLYAAATAAAFARAYLRTTPIEPLSDNQRLPSAEPGDPEARRLERELLKLKIEQHQRANAIVPVVKQQGPGAHAANAFLANFHVENLGDRNFVLKDYWCEVLPSDVFRKQFSAPAHQVEPLQYKLKLKSSQLVKPGELGQLSLRLALDDIRAWFPTVRMPNPSIWRWTYVDLWVHIRCEGGGNQVIHHERIT